MSWSLSGKRSCMTTNLVTQLFGDLPVDRVGRLDASIRHKRMP